MKKLIVVLALSFIFGGALKSSAFQMQLPIHSWGVEPHNSYIKYVEPGVMDEEGFMFGVGATYTYHNSVMFKSEARFGFGLVHYDGTGTKDNYDYMVELRNLFGYDFIARKTTVTPFIGVGYRYLVDDFRGTTSTDAWGYIRESNYYYSPIGIEALTNMNALWSVALLLEYDYFWQGTQKSHFSDGGTGWGDISNDQEDGYGVRGSIKLHKKGAGVNYEIESYYIYWDIEDSNYVLVPGSWGTYGYEPANYSQEYGVSITVQF
ncbi:MAG: hypothetical protein V3V95_03940 [Thermodesulfobacteriota bacterium]